MSTIEHPMSITAGTILSTGIIVGILNVFTKPDHLSSMATLSGMNISNDRSRCDSFKLGINWGIGNSISTLVVGSVLIAIESPQDGVDIQWWSIMIEAVISVFVFGLGCYGMYNALKNKKKNDGRAWWHDESLTLKDEEAEGDEETVQCSTKSSESITRMMADVLNEDATLPQKLFLSGLVVVYCQEWWKSLMRITMMISMMIYSTLTREVLVKVLHGSCQRYLNLINQSHREGAKVSWHIKRKTNLICQELLLF